MKRDLQLQDRNQDAQPLRTAVVNAGPRYRK